MDGERGRKGTQGREWKTLTLNFLYPHSPSKELGCMVNVRLRSPSGKVGIDGWGEGQNGYTGKGAENSHTQFPLPPFTFQRIRVYGKCKVKKSVR